jgi:hypothetical protein
MQHELQDVVRAFLIDRVSQKHLPPIPDHIVSRVVQLGMFGARMRGTVSRDTYHNDIITQQYGKRLVIH